MAKTVSMKMPPAGLGGHRFSMVPRADIPRSKFNLSRAYKTTFNEGLLVPVACQEIVPGDTFNWRMTALCRLNTPLRPIMDNMYFESFFFFIPCRLLWANWQKFNGEQVNPGDSTSFVMPVIGGPYTPGVGSLFDYFGVALGGGVGTIQTADNIIALPFRAYNLTYNQWFRDENMINSAFTTTGDGPDGSPGTNFIVQRRGKRHDYFTSCLPFVQKGVASAAAVQPISGAGAHDIPTFWNVTANAATNALTVPAASGSQPVSTVNPSATAGSLGWLNPNLTVFVNDLRQAIAIQRWFERDARGGTRYTEIVRAHFGVVSPDARLQRPEYLGGGSTPINIAPLAQTAPQQASGVVTPQGNLVGVGTATVHGHGFAKSFTEHGYVIALISVRADLTYQDGVERFWFRSTRQDWYWPAFSHLGEQAVLQREIYFRGGAGGNTTVFGYQERYGEMRYGKSMITGLFNSNAATPLDSWHLSQHFTAAPTLNQAFIEENAPISRVVAVTTEPDFRLDVFHDVKAARPMPTYGVPGLMDHF